MIRIFADHASAAAVALYGAPDEHIGEKQIPSSSRRTPVMQVEMTQDVIDDMLQSIRDGRPPMIQFSQNPVRAPSSCCRVDASH